MILTAHQPVYLPWLGLFHKIALSDVFCIFDDVQYLKKDWNNRNKIKTNTGDLFLTVPVFTKGYKAKPIREIQINNSISWRRKHWNTIRLAYKKAPYFNRYADFFENLYKKEWDNLVKLNDYILFYLLNELGITVEICRASDKKFKGKKNSLVIDMCKKLCADTYIFGVLGKNYAEVEEFEKVGINVAFQDYVHPVYPQSHGEFIPYMSVVDLLFNCGDSSLDILMSGNVHKQDIETLFCQKG